MAGLVTFCLSLTIVCIGVGKLLISGDVVLASLQFSKESNVKLTGSVLSEIQAVRSPVKCAAVCRRTAFCRSFNYDKTDMYCQLNRDTKSNNPGDVFQDNKYSYYEMENQSISIDLSTKEPITLEPKTEQPTSTEHTTSKEPTTTLHEPTLEPTTQQTPSLEPTTTLEPTPEQSTSKEPTTTSKEPTTISTEPTTTLEPTTEQTTSQEPTTTLEPTTQQTTSEEPTTTLEPTTQQTTESGKR